MFNNKVLGKYIYIAIFVLIVWIVTRTSIIKDHKEKPKKEKE